VTGRLDRIIARVLLAAYALWCWLLHPAPTDPTGPDTSDDQEERPASGADARFGAELRAMRSVGVDSVGQELLANLKASALAEVAAHEKVAATIDALCDSLEAELAAICDRIITAAKTCDRRHTRELRLDARGRAWLAAGLPGDTGEYRVVAA
jgi:hypothetical protein